MKRLLPLLPLLILASCGNPPPPVGGELPKRVYARVVSLSPSTTEWVALLNSTNVLVGRTAADTRPDIIKGITIVANPTPDIEKIIKLQPDLIIVDENLINANVLAKLREQEQWDVEVFSVNSLKDWQESIWKLGALLNQHTAASENVDKVEQSIRNAAQNPVEPKPMVIVAMGGTKPWVAGTESFQADLVRKAGGEPVGPSGDKFASVGPEQILAWNPDCVFVSDSVSGYVGPGWAGTSAFKSKRIMQVQADLLLRPGAEVARLIDAIAKELRNPGGDR